MLFWATEGFVDNTYMHLTTEEVQGLDRQSHATLQLHVSLRCCPPPACVSQHHKAQAD